MSWTFALGVRSGVMSGGYVRVADVPGLRRRVLRSGLHNVTHGACDRPGVYVRGGEFCARNLRIGLMLKCF